RGDTFYGEIIVGKSGASSKPIVFGAYGSGNKPIISGFTTLSSWSSIGSGVYAATVSPQSNVNLVTFNGNFQPMGRYPKLTASNSGYLSFQSVSGITSVTSNAISGLTSFVGGEIVIRANHSNLDRGTVLTQSSTIVAYTMISGGAINYPTAGY